MRLAREKPRGFQVLGSGSRRFHGKLNWSPQGDDSYDRYQRRSWYSLYHYGIAPINDRKEMDSWSCFSPIDEVIALLITSRGPPCGISSPYKQSTQLEAV